MVALDRSGVFSPAPLTDVDTALRQNLTINQCPWFGDLCATLPLPLLIVNDSGHAVLANDRFLDLVGAAPDADVLGAATEPLVLEELGLEARPLRVLGESYTLLTAPPGAGRQHRRALERVFFHDLLNTAGGVQGLSEVLGDAEAEEIPVLQATVRDLADQLVEEITAQRDLLAAESGDLRVRTRVVDARAQMHLVAARYRNHPAAGDREILLVPGRTPGPLVTDPVLLGRVLGNMLKNALEAVPDGSVVTLDCGRKGAFVWFSVQNPGFVPPLVRDRLFERAFSTKGQGRGMGTFSMKLLTEKYLAGSVGMTSDATRGTTFTVTLPCDGP
jgi:signal transduction histidine kinase